MKREIYDKRNELYNKSRNLRSVTFDVDKQEKVEEIRKKQDDLYKRFVFYNNIMKASDKIK